MKLIQYVGSRATKTDNVAGTGLAWTSKQVHPVMDDAAATLLKYPSVWREVGGTPELVAPPVAEVETPAPAPAPWPRQRTRALKPVA